MGKNYKFSSPSTFSTARAPTLLFVVLVSIWSTLNIPGVEGAFARRCGSGCMFSPGGELHAGFHYLGCKNTMCTCEQGNRPDVPKWPLTWDEQTKTCLTADYGPCGKDRGLDIGCQPGFECIEYLCRDPKKLGQTTEGQICYGQIDCVDGLACETVESQEPLEAKRCLQPHREQLLENIIENGTQSTTGNSTESSINNITENSSIWSTSTVPTIDGILNRSCSINDSVSSCVFSTGAGLHRGFFFLGCKNESCVCKQEIMTDAPVWPLTWNEQNGTCLTADYGPCGTDRGLEIGCHPGFECIGNRCRNPKKLSKKKKGQICYGQIDCAKGLFCNKVENPGPWDGTRCVSSGAEKLGGADLSTFINTFKFSSVIFVQSATFLLYNSS